jgi:hypothetical protein
MTSNPFDAAASPIGNPVTIIAGSYINWRKSFDYDSALFVVYCSFRMTGEPLHKITGVYQSGGYWSFAIPSVTSANWTVGQYAIDYSVKRISDSEEAIVESGQIEITLPASDRRIHAQIMLAKIESILENRADNDVDSYSISGRSISKMPITELRKWREYYKSEIAENSTGRKTNKVKVMFG